MFSLGWQRLKYSPADACCSCGVGGRFFYETLFGKKESSDDGMPEGGAINCRSLKT